MRSLFFLPLLIGFSGSAFADSETFKIDVSAKGYRDYSLSGTDRNGSVSGKDPTVTVNKGDTIIFDIDASRHPFYIKTEFSRGDGDQVTTGTISGTPGTQNGKYHGILRAYQHGNTIMFVLCMHFLEWEVQFLLNK